MKETNERVVIFSLWLMVFASASQIMIVAPILPRIAEELSVDKSTLGFLITIYAVCVGFFALVTGPISDRIGRRRILMIGTGLLTFALLMHGFASSYAALLVIRALAGAAGGILSGGAVSYVGDFFPLHRRGWASGWVLSGIAAGQILGIPLGTLLADWMGFRAPFLAFSGVAFTAFLLLLFVIPQPNVELSRSLSVRGAVGGYRQLLQRKEVIVACIVFTTMFMGVSLFVTFFPTWLESERGFTPGMVSMLYVIGGIANVIGGPQAGRLSDRIGRTKVIVVASTCVALLMPTITLIPKHHVWIIYPLFFMTMLMVASRMSPLQALMTQIADGKQRGMLMSLVMSMGQVGLGLGSGMAALMWKVAGFTGNALLAMSSVLVMAGLVWVFLQKFENASDKGGEGAREEKKEDSEETKLVGAVLGEQG